jgi:hypothetical protein
MRRPVPSCPCVEGAGSLSLHPQGRPCGWAPTADVLGRRSVAVHLARRQSYLVNVGYSLRKIGDPLPVHFPEYRTYEQLRIAANDAMMALLIGSRLGAHTLDLNTGSAHLLPEIWPSPNAPWLCPAVTPGHPLEKGARRQPDPFRRVRRRRRPRAAHHDAQATRRLHHPAPRAGRRSPARGSQRPLSRHKSSLPPNAAPGQLQRSLPAYRRAPAPGQAAAVVLFVRRGPPRIARGAIRPWAAVGGPR